jgi:hypothetical protein
MHMHIFLPFFFFFLPGKSTTGSSSSLKNKQSIKMIKENKHKGDDDDHLRNLTISQSTPSFPAKNRNPRSSSHQSMLSI